VKKKKKRTVNKPQTDKSSAYLSIGIIAVIILVVAGYLFMNPSMLAGLSSLLSQSKTDTEELVPTGSPSPSISPTPYPIAQGQYTYSFSWGPGTTVPKMTTLTVDPHDPKVGQKQTVSLHMTHTAPIESISLVLTTDTQKNTYPLTLTEGINTDGTWTGSWDITEVHDYNYILTPMVKTGGKEIPYKTVIRELP
jgi:hypothetical protein